MRADKDFNDCGASSPRIEDAAAKAPYARGAGKRGSQVGRLAAPTFLDYDAHSDFFYELRYRLEQGEPRQVTRPRQEFSTPDMPRWAFQMMRENRPPLEISSGAGYRAPEYVWRTPIHALRRPSQHIAGLQYQDARRGIGSAENTAAFERVDFLVGDDEMPSGWHIERGSTDRPVGRPMVPNPSKATLRKRRQRERDKLHKREEIAMLEAAPTVAERITKLENDYARQKDEIAEVARQVGITFDDEGVSEAVERFLEDLNTENN